jgi:hypothetical protein
MANWRLVKALTLGMCWAAVAPVIDAPASVVRHAEADASPTSSVPDCAAPRHTPDGTDGLGGCWPGPNTTGVPASVSLRPYTGPCTISASGGLIESRTIDCDLRIAGSDVVIRWSVINGTVTVLDGGSLTIEDSELVGQEPRFDGYTMIGPDDLAVSRLAVRLVVSGVEVRGGNRGILCARDCVVRDSWIHGQYVLSDQHVSAIRISQGATLIHNAIACDVLDNTEGGGCSADLTGYGDVEPVMDNLISHNLFVATPGGYCAYGGSSGDNGVKPYGHLAANIDFVGNIFQRGSSGECGRFGPVADFDPNRPGNSWIDNRWSTGEPLDITDS